MKLLNLIVVVMLLLLTFCVFGAMGVSVSGTFGSSDTSASISTRWAAGSDASLVDTIFAGSSNGHFSAGRIGFRNSGSGNLSSGGENRFVTNGQETARFRWAVTRAQHITPPTWTFTPSENPADVNATEPVEVRVAGLSAVNASSISCEAFAQNRLGFMADANLNIISGSLNGYSADAYASNDTVVVSQAAGRTFGSSVTVDAWAQRGAVRSESRNRVRSISSLSTKSTVTPTSMSNVLNLR